MSAMARATEADESGATINAIQSTLADTKADTTLRYIRRRSPKSPRPAATSARPIIVTERRESYTAESPIEKRGKTRS